MDGGNGELNEMKKLPQNNQGRSSSSKHLQSHRTPLVHAYCSMEVVRRIWGQSKTPTDVKKIFGTTIVYLAQRGSTVGS